jgi:hypothetical protein
MTEIEKTVVETTSIVEDDEIPEGADDLSGADAIEEDVVVEDADGELLDDEDIGEGEADEEEGEDEEEEEEEDAD